MTAQSTDEFESDATGDDELTDLLERWSQGDSEARDTLVRRVMPQLRRLAAHQLRKERRDHPLQATALVNEAFSRLLEQRALRFECRGQFLAFAAELMRRVLVDHARAYKAKKRGEGQELAPLDEALGFAPEKSEELIQLDEALADLARFNPEGAKVVEMRYFVGLNHQEVADALGINRSKVRRLWTESRAWLYLQMRVDSEEPPASSASDEDTDSEKDSL